MADIWEQIKVGGDNNKQCKKPWPLPRPGIALGQMPLHRPPQARTPWVASPLPASASNVCAEQPGCAVAASWLAGTPCRCPSGACRCTPCCPPSQNIVWSRAGRWPTRGKVAGWLPWSHWHGVHCGVLWELHQHACLPACLRRRVLRQVAPL